MHVHSKLIPALSDASIVNERQAKMRTFKHDEDFKQKPNEQKKKMILFSFFVLTNSHKCSTSTNEQSIENCELV